jgi:hypothetical protein
VCLIVAKRPAHCQARSILMRKPYSSRTQAFSIRPFECFYSSSCLFNSLRLSRKCRFMIIWKLCNFDSSFRRIRAHHGSRITTISYENCVLVKHQWTARWTTIIIRILFEDTLKQFQKVVSTIISVIGWRRFLYTLGWFYENLMEIYRDWSQ